MNYKVSVFAGLERKKGQGSLEYLIIIAAVLAISAIVVLFVTGAFSGAGAAKDVSLCKSVASNCGNKLATGGSACVECEEACAPGGRDATMSVNLCKFGLTQSIVGDPSLIQGFHFDEGVRTTTLDGVSGVQTTGNPVWSTDGVFKNAIGTRTSANSITYSGGPAADLSKGFTFESFVRFNAPAASFSSNIFARGQWGAAFPMVWIYVFTDATRAYSLNYHWTDPGGAIRFYSNAALNLQNGQWYHFALVHDTVASRTRTYVDGVKIIDAAIANPSVRSFSTQTGYFGGSNAWSKPGNVDVDEARFYNRPLSDAEIAVHAKRSP